MKRFLLDGAELEEIVVGLGAGTATDRIVVDGSGVGYMYREEPINDVDSGWRFFAGDEDERYMQDPSKHAFYSVNTIANYDIVIINYLHLPIGTALEKDETGFMRIVEGEG